MCVCVSVCVCLSVCVCETGIMNHSRIARERQELGAGCYLGHTGSDILPTQRDVPENIQTEF